MKRQWMMIVGLLTAVAVFTYVQAQNEEPAPAQDAAQNAAEVAPVAPAADAAPLPEGLATLEQRMSYIIGMNMGREFKQNNLDIDVKALNTGLTDAMAGKQAQLSNAQMQETMMAAQQQMMAKQQKAAQENLAAGKAFLEANAKKEGVVTLESGLQYKVLEEGDGATPVASDTVAVHYRGTLIDGTVFETSVGGEPLEIPVQGVIPGWVEALQKMKVGSKWQLFIPANLAYGARGGPGGPNSALVFEVELLEIK